MKIFLDTNFIINLIIYTEHTEKTRKILSNVLDSSFYTSINVVEEVMYITKKLTKMSNKETSKYVKNVIDNLEINVITDLPLSEFIEIFENYNLLPNDALIAATCRYYGIKKIATFDEDFKRVDFLEVVEV